MILCWFASSGGVVVASQDGKIVLENTLDARLDVVYKQKLPEVCNVECSCNSDSQLSW